MLHDVEQLRHDFGNLLERHLDLQTRSMRENLIFSGIPEKAETEDTEEIISQFMDINMKITFPISFHRAHRFGKNTQVLDENEHPLYNTRPIVCRFKNFKDRELVRNAARNLKATKFGVNERFPKEINDKRHSLWPYFKEAKSQKKKAHFKRDKLFIESVEFLPSVNVGARMEITEREQHLSQGTRPKQFGNTRRAPRK
ncbi:hypothetical protein SNE40_021248 [Patella caerulea]|uniref:Uncharacterized protein n=1 Tax=Patella caerulea TaxID=87958 RepID=A0AAN8G3L3_PATCE